jgi:hypothetical protein
MSNKVESGGFRVGVMAAGGELHFRPLIEMPSRLAGSRMVLRSDQPFSRSHPDPEFFASSISSRCFAIDAGPGRFISSTSDIFP